MPSKAWVEIFHLNPNGATVEVWDWVVNFILRFIKDVITDLCMQDYILCMHPILKLHVIANHA